MRRMTRLAGWRRAILAFRCITSLGRCTCLVNWNAWKDVVECIDTVLAQNHSDFHVFVIDNDSKDSSVERIAKWCAAPQAEVDWRRFHEVSRWTDRHDACPLPVRHAGNVGTALGPAPRGGVTLIAAGGNLGFAGGNNVGLLAAGLEDFDYYWLLNTDTVVERNALSCLVQRCAADTRIGMVGSTLCYYDEPTISRKDVCATRSMARSGLDRPMHCPVFRWWWQPPPACRRR